VHTLAPDRIQPCWAAWKAKKALASDGPELVSWTRIGRRPFAMPRFLIGIHQARAHHFDFRLEKQGVFKGWTVPELEHFLADLGSDFDFACRGHWQPRSFNRIIPALRAYEQSHTLSS
jgi:hypothetical protein